MRNKLSRFLALMTIIFVVTAVVVFTQWLMSLPQSAQTLLIGGIAGASLTTIACLAGLTPIAAGAWLASQFYQRRQSYYPPQPQRYQQPPILVWPQQPMLPPSYPQQQPRLTQDRRFEIIGKENNQKESYNND